MRLHVCFTLEYMVYTRRKNRLYSILLQINKSPFQYVERRQNFSKLPLVVYKKYTAFFVIPVMFVYRLNCEIYLHLNIKYLFLQILLFYKIGFKHIIYIYSNIYPKILFPPRVVGGGTMVQSVKVRFGTRIINKMCVCTNKLYLKIM